MSQPPDTPRRASGVQDVRPRASRWLWVLPALTFLVGLAVGLLWAGGSDGDEEPGRAVGAGESATPSPGPSPTPSDLLVRVPEPCLALAEESERAFAVFDRAVDAARELDARRLQEVVDEVQDLSPRVEDLADACRSRAGEDVLEGETVTATPTPEG